MNRRSTFLLLLICSCGFELLAAPELRQSELNPPTKKEALNIYNLYKRVYEGDHTAQLALDKMKMAGKLPEEFQKNPFVLEEKANSGDLEAMYDIGKCHIHGWAGVVKDQEKGAEWIKKSADLGYAKGMKEYAWLNAHNKFNKASPSVADEYFKKAAQAGDSSGLYNSGLKYLRSGDGLLAKKCFQQLIDKKDPRGALGMATLMLGKAADEQSIDRFECGRLTLESLMYYEQAHELGDARATDILAQIYLVGNRSIKIEQDLAKAIKYSELAAASLDRPSSEGTKASALRLAEWFDKGLHVEANNSKAFEYYSTAAKLKNSKALQWLINYYEKAGDKMNAVKWSLVFATIKPAEGNAMHAELMARLGFPAVATQHLKLAGEAGNKSAALKLALQKLDQALQGNNLMALETPCRNLMQLALEIQPGSNDASMFQEGLTEFFLANLPASGAQPTTRVGLLSARAKAITRSQTVKQFLVGLDLYAYKKENHELLVKAWRSVLPPQG